MPRRERVIDSVEDVRLDEADAIRNTVSLGISARDFERSLGNICGHNRGARQLVRERHREAAAAGADVRDGNGAASVHAESFECRFDDELG